MDAFLHLVSPLQPVITEGGEPAAGLPGSNRRWTRAILESIIQANGVAFRSALLGRGSRTARIGTARNGTVCPGRI